MGCVLFATWIPPTVHNWIAAIKPEGALGQAGAGGGLEAFVFAEVDQSFHFLGGGAVETCRWRNANHRDWMAGPSGEVIPDRIITKPPSAELRDDQKDSDSLPDYPELDAILDILIDRDGSIADCVAAGFDRATAQKVERLIYLSEYKRFQSAPGARLTKRAFWLDRRYPIVNRWRDPS